MAELRGEDMIFRYVSFWVHFHKLHFACYSRESATAIGSLLGKVEHVDLEEEKDQSWGKSLRIKIQIEVESPLKCGIFLKSEKEGKHKWIAVTYEKLPDFCYGCGLLGHTIRECEGNCGSIDEELPYGPSLRELTILKMRETETMNNPYPSFFGRGMGRGRECARGSWRNLPTEEVENTHAGFQNHNHEEEDLAPPENSTPIRPDSGKPTIPTTARRVPVVLSKKESEVNLDDVRNGEISGETIKENPNGQNLSKSINDKDSDLLLMDIDQKWVGPQEGRKTSCKMETKADSNGPNFKPTEQKSMEESQSVNDCNSESNGSKNKNVDTYGTSKSQENRESGKFRTWRRLSRMQDSEEPGASQKSPNVVGIKWNLELDEEDSNKKKVIIINDQNNARSVEAAKQPRRAQ